MSQAESPQVGQRLLAVLGLNAAGLLHCCMGPAIVPAHPAAAACMAPAAWLCCWDSRLCSLLAAGRWLHQTFLAQLRHEARLLHGAFSYTQAPRVWCPRAVACLAKSASIDGCTATATHTCTHCHARLTPPRLRQ